jgi:hypothetical protein
MTVNIFFQRTHYVSVVRSGFRFQRTLTCPLISSFQNSIDSSVCLSVSTLGCRRPYYGTTCHSHVPSTAF